MPVLVTGIHVVRNSWMAGTSPAMTTERCALAITARGYDRGMYDVAPGSPG
jgi:hypothetical protein